MRILISNDDGVDSPGIRALLSAVADMGEVVVVAPHRERSTSGHSLTLHKPLRIFEVGKNIFATTGTPADCVYLGVRQILKKPPDLILSGINAGANLGTDVHYSGTVAAAREGAMLNIPSFAFSLVYSAHSPDKQGPVPFKFSVAASAARQALGKFISCKVPPGTLMNINIPNLEQSEIKGTRLTHLGFRRYSSEVSERVDPRGKPYYWIGGAYVGFDEDPESDCQAIEEKFVSVTPVRINATHYDLLSELRRRY